MENVMGVDQLNIEGLNELEHKGPVVMVNLMRFHERSLDGTTREASDGIEVDVAEYR